MSTLARNSAAIALTGTAKVLMTPSIRVSYGVHFETLAPMLRSQRAGAKGRCMLEGTAEPIHRIRFESACHGQAYRVLNVNMCSTRRLFGWRESYREPA